MDFKTKSIFPLVLIMFLAVFALGPGLAIQQGAAPSISLDTLSTFKFMQDFLTGSVALGIFVAIIVNLFKPKIPEGYSDTFSTIVTIVTLSLIFIAKAFYPNLTLLGLERLFDDLTKYSPLWTPILAWIIRYISGEAHSLLAGIPFIGRSNEFPSIGSPHVQRD